MQKVLASLAFVSALAVGTSNAYAFGIAADAGLSRIMNGDGQNGFGANVYIRPIPLPLITPEIQVGFHRFAPEGATITEIPIMVGGRFGLPVPMLSPFVGAHVGLMRTGISIDILGESVSDSEMDVAFNVGAGLNFLDLPLLSVGVAAWYNMIMSEGETGKMLTAGVQVEVGL
jgi:hypothetical protein